MPTATSATRSYTRGRRARVSLGVGGVCLARAQHASARGVYKFEPTALSNLNFKVTDTSCSEDPKKLLYFFHTLKNPKKFFPKSTRRVLRCAQNPTTRFVGA